MAGSSTRTAKRTRQPVWKDVEEQEARKRGARSRKGKKLRRRYAMVHDTSGPKVRLGLLWFVGALVAILLGPLPTAIVYGTVAGFAAAQTTRCWRRRRYHPNELGAAVIAGGMGVGACLGAGGAGLALLGGVGLTTILALGDTKSKSPLIADVGWTIQCSLPVGIVAMSMVLLCRLDQGSAIALLLLVSAYEVGDFLVGSGSRNPYEGPAAGGAAIVVITFIISTLPISVHNFAQAWLFGGAVLILAPLGQLLASAILPSVKARASGLRRLDSLLLAAPLWCFGVGIILDKGL